MDSGVRDQLTNRISSFDGSVSSLGHLVADLDAIWSAHTWNEMQRKTLRREWSKLEQVFAAAVEGHMRALAPGDESYVREVLSRLPQLLPPARSAEGKPG